MPARLKNGVMGAPGGKRDNSGRKPSEFLEKCRELAGSPKFLTWARAVIDGEPAVDFVLLDGAVRKVPAAPDDRIKLWEKIAAYGFGKPPQTLEHKAEDLAASLTAILGRAAEQRGLKE